MLPSRPSCVYRKPIRIRNVDSLNVESEFRIISGFLKDYPFISMDTEFPGVVYHNVPDTPDSVARDRYALLRANINALKLIQVGLTFSDSASNLPDLGTNYCYVWQFNFNFDPWCDLHAPESIELLHKNGIDFERNRFYGIDEARFGFLMKLCGLVGNNCFSWITFHSAYDFGYLIKVVTQRELPDDIGEFLKLMKDIFGYKVYDIKYLMRFCHNLYGGLERVANELGVDRAVGKCHQAASDSLLTLHVFTRLKDRGFQLYVPDHCGVLYGLKYPLGNLFSLN
ncbi:probable CCR4-associated factor 1 homolog 11 [Magnolia sinica]|uniref:probable CCR4-associated factor 1 homolog 11 n=1 Tax=Magnolia sinica TaxID=86752 RepID=UPI002658130C|nr:probable CCR4-associated factor 1 homolog 11 [Magnolia sinica]